MMNKHGVTSLDIAVDLVIVYLSKVFSNIFRPTNISRSFFYL